MECLNDLNINWNEVEEQGFTPLPEGTYAGKIIGAEVKTSKKGGKYLSLKYQLLGAKGIKGRTIYDNCTISNTSEVATNIGLGKIKNIASLLGLEITEVENFQEFIDADVPLGLKLKIRSSEDYGDQNEVKKVLEFSEEFLEPAEQEGF